MKREIKFKFWLHSIEMMTPPHTLEDIASNIVYNLANCLPLQATGLKDKHGTDIYEGDIIYISDLGLGNLLVEYSNGGFQFFIDNSLALAESFTPCYHADSEIVGNIFENPELWEHNKQKDI